MAKYFILSNICINNIKKIYIVNFIKIVPAKNALTNTNKNIIQYQLLPTALDDFLRQDMARY